MEASKSEKSNIEHQISKVDSIMFLCKSMSYFILNYTDPEIEAMMTPYRIRVKEEGDKTIARTAVTLNGDCRKVECNMGRCIYMYVSASIIDFGCCYHYSKLLLKLPDLKMFNVVFCKAIFYLMHLRK